MAFFAVLLLSWHGVFRATRKCFPATFEFPIITLPIVVLALLLWLQVAAGLLGFNGDAFITTLYLLLCIATVAIGRASSGEQRALAVLGFFMLVGAFLSAFIAFVQTFELWETSSWINRMPTLRRPGGNLGQPNQLATLLLMGLVSLVFLYEIRKLGVVSSILFAITLLVGIAASESRTGVLSLAFLILWWTAKRTSLGSRLVALGGVVRSLGVLVFILVLAQSAGHHSANQWRWCSSQHR